MKQGRKPTRNQKKLFIEYGLNPAHWLIFKKINGELHLVHRETGKTKILPDIQGDIMGKCHCKNGRGFYQTKVDPETHQRYIKFCDHEPEPKYKRMCETIKRIQSYEPTKEEK